MNANVISIGIVTALAAALGCAVMHPIAKRMRWKFVPRYVSGVAVCNGVYAFVIFAALPLETAAVLYGLLWLIYGLGGLATWISHEDVPDPRSTTAEADQLLRDALNEELRK
jgi:hypothetical protein